ncbi:MAG: hypothetical protein AABY07_10390 [Nanoarchaeota archaeon]
MNTKNHPVHNKKRLEFSSPKGLEQKLQEYPLNKGFIDWVVNLGYKIRYLDMLPAGGTSFDTREIFIRVYQKPLVSHDLVLVHELIHISVPIESIDRVKKYEYVIDKIAKRYAKDKEFMDYIKKSIKIQPS